MIDVGVVEHGMAVPKYLAGWFGLGLGKNIHNLGAVLFSAGDRLADSGYIKGVGHHAVADLLVAVGVGGVTQHQNFAVLQLYPAEVEATAE